jgi:tetratricopeptide (TPR) repeat protein
LRAENDLAGSLAAYSRATEIDPGLFLAQFKKGHVSSFQGDIEGASRAYRAAIDGAPPEQKATLAMLSAHRHLFVGDLQGTLDELMRLADSLEAMGTPPAMVEEFQVQILTEYAAAKDHAEAARELVANDPNPRRLEPYYRLLGTVALRSGDAEQAAVLLRKADVAGDLLVRYDLARAEEASGHPDEARDLYLEVSRYNFNSIGFALTRSEAAARAAALQPELKSPR